MNRDHESYRSRVQDIRSEARSLIERLRSERLAKSRFAPRAEAPASLPVPGKAEIEAWTGGPHTPAVLVPDVLPTSAAPTFSPPTPLAEPAPDSITIKAPAKAKQARAGQAKAKAMTERKALSATVQASAVKASPATSAPVEMPAATMPVAAMPVAAMAKPKRRAKSAVAAEKPQALDHHNLDHHNLDHHNLEHCGLTKPVPTFVRNAQMATMSPVRPGKASAPGTTGHQKPGPVAAMPQANTPEIATTEPKPPKPAKPIARVPQMTGKPAQAAVVRAAVVRAAGKTSAKRESTHPDKPGHSTAAPSVSLLPGIGPGLVWRLEQSGYRTLEDVAKARTEDLAAKLGAVGRLVKIDRWIDFAKQAIAA